MYKSPAVRLPTLGRLQELNERWKMGLDDVEVSDTSTRRGHRDAQVASYMKQTNKQTNKQRPVSEQVADLRECMRNAVQSYARVDELVHAGGDGGYGPKPRHPRLPGGRSPSPDENPLNAW